MLVKHAFGIAGGTAGVAQPARVALVPLMPGIIAGFGGDPLRESVLAVGRIEADIMFDRRPLRLHLFDQGREGAVV